MSLSRVPATAAGAAGRAECGAAGCGQPRRAWRVLQAAHRSDTGFVPTANPDRDFIIVTRNAPLISDREQEATWRVCHRSGSFIGGGEAEIKATADEAAEYLGRSPHRLRETMN
jgi:hypothetical protein